MRLVEFPLLYVKRAGLSGLALAREGSFHRTMAKNKVGTQSVGWEKLWLAPTRATTLVRFSRPLLLLLLRLRGPGSRRLLMKARAHESGISPPDGNKMTPKTTDGILSSSSCSSSSSFLPCLSIETCFYLFFTPTSSGMAFIRSDAFLARETMMTSQTRQGPWNRILIRTLYLTTSRRLNAWSIRWQHEKRKVTKSD